MKLILSDGGYLADGGSYRQPVLYIDGLAYGPDDVVSSIDDLVGFSAADHVRQSWDHFWSYEEKAWVNRFLDPVGRGRSIARV